MSRFPSPLRSLAIAALAAAGATASHAQSSEVAVFGLMDLSVGRSEAPGAKASSNINSGNMTTSFIGVKGSEDLGGGMNAVFSIESFLRGDTGAAGRFDGDTFWARNAYVGIAHAKLGTVTLGRNTTALFVNTLLFNSFGDSFGFSPAIRQTFTSGGAVQVSGDTGWSDSVKYASPGFGGLSFTAHGAMGEANGGRNVGVSALYFAGPVAAGFAWQDVKKGTGPFNPDTRAWQLGASYNLAPVKLYAQYGSNDNRTADNTTTVIGLGADWTIGLGKVLLQWNKLSPDVGNSQKALSLGYDHLLSKRTDVYAVYMNEKQRTVGSANSYAVGVRHRF